MRRTLSLVAPFAAAVIMIAAVFVYRTLPPRAAVLDGALPPTVILGGYHIHSNRSDGSGSIDDIATAAHDAGLQFIILTDHGDATRAPLAPAYRDGVLCIDAVEIGTSAGHLVALGLTVASPYPLAGHPADVLEDVHRQGGWGVVAHPDSPKPELQWRDWNVPYDGVEWLNADSEWRDESTVQLAGLAARLVIRPPETLASMFATPAITLRRWDAALRRRPVVGLAGLDAHANLLGRPRYVDMFRALAQAVVLDAPLAGDPARDAGAVLSALRAGRTYSIVGGFASPAVLTFEAGTESGTANVAHILHMGDRAAPTGTITWRASVPQVPSAHIRLLADGRPVTSGRGSLTYLTPATAGVYRIEVDYPGFAMPWIVSNPIVIGTTDPPIAPRALAPAPAAQSLDLLASSTWQVEHDATSTASIAHEDAAIRLAYALGAGRPNAQYAAAVVSTQATTGIDRVAITARADRPMRVSLQVRLPGAAAGQRWRRSIYLDTTPRTIVVPLDAFEPADRPTSQRPIVAVVRDLLVVVDTVNSLPGSSGTIWISGASLGEARAEATSGRSESARRPR